MNPQCPICTSRESCIHSTARNYNTANAIGSLEAIQKKLKALWFEWDHADLIDGIDPEYTDRNFNRYIDQIQMARKLLEFAAENLETYRCHTVP